MPVLKITDDDTPVYESEMVHRLREAGIPEPTITAVLDRTTGIQRVFYKPEDEEIADAMRQIVWRAWAFAMEVFDNGAERTKLALARTILGKTAHLIGRESTTTHEETQRAITRIFSKMTDVAASEPLLTLPPPESDNLEQDGLGPARGVEPPRDEEPLKLGLDPWDDASDDAS